MTIRDIREQYHLTQQAMADRFGIPKRTIEDWDAGRRNPPDYVIRMMVEILGMCSKT